MLHWLGTFAIVALLALDLALPSLSIARRGNEAVARADAENAVGAVGETLPRLSLQTLEGEPFRLADLRGHPVLLTFERSVDW